MGSCCGRSASKKSMKYVWSGPGGTSKTFNTEIEAKAWVMRKGGSYRAVPK